MGSFNTTCFASQQTIAPRNKCYVIPITQQLGYDAVKLTKDDKSSEAYAIARTTCYPTAFYRPFAQFIAAEYDDYGQVIIDDTPENLEKVANFYDSLYRACYTAAEGKNKSHDIPFDPKVMAEQDITDAWEYMWTAAVHELRLFVTDYQNRPVQLTFAVISKEAYDYLINFVDGQVNWDDESYLREAVLSRLEATLKEEDSETSITDKFKSFRLEDIVKNAIDNFRQEGMPYFHNPRIHEYVKEFQDTKTFSDSTKSQMKKDMEMSYVFSALTRLNLKLTPIVYASQDYDNSIGKDYATFVRSVSAAITKKQKRMYND